MLRGADVALAEPAWDRKTSDGLTIFVPAWNHRLYLARSIRSALAAADYLERDGFAAEVIVVDDASRDGSQKFLRSLSTRYGDPRFLSLVLSENRGLPRVRNLGLHLSRFRHVLFLDADNELLPENTPCFLRAGLATQAAVIYGNLLDRKETEIVGLRSNEMASMRLTQGNYIDAFAIVDAEKMLRLGGFTSHPDLYGWEDWELMLHLIAEEERIVFVPLVMGYYHLLPLSMLQETNREADTGLRALHRMHTQSGTREWDRSKVGCMYHPDLGWIHEP